MRRSAIAVILIERPIRTMAALRIACLTYGVKATADTLRRDLAVLRAAKIEDRHGKGRWLPFQDFSDDIVRNDPQDLGEASRRVETYHFDYSWSP